MQINNMYNRLEQWLWLDLWYIWFLPDFIAKIFIVWWMVIEITQKCYVVVLSN